jgi:hypothetical protein
MENSLGSVSAELVLSPGGEITENPSSTVTVPTARLYHILNPGEYYTRAVAIANNIWTWTAAQAISASLQNNVLDISVSFPIEETHYMIIRGIRPFSRIQLYDKDYRTDPQFERYDSSGWSYVSAEQSLLVKMRHRSVIEHIRIFF